MEETAKKKSKKLIRLIIAICIATVSLTIGVVSGVLISSINRLPSKVLSKDELAMKLEANWYSDIYYGKDAGYDAIEQQLYGQGLDPYTYLTKLETVSQQPTKKGKLGITVTSMYNFPTVIDVDKDGAAYGKIQKGDIIVSAGKESYDECSIYSGKYTYSTLLSSVLGDIGDIAHIKLYRLQEGALKEIKVDITLKEAPKIKYAYEEETTLEDTLKVKLTGFTAANNQNTDGTYDQLKKIIEQNNQKENKAKKIIINLVDNGGGDLSSVVNICDLFLPKDKLVTSLIYKDGTKTDYYTKSDQKYEFDKIYVYQNENTASASEILISTLDYYLKDKVEFVGSKSYGKGIAQRTDVVLGGRYTLQYTCAKWVRPDGNWIGMTGSKFVEGYQLGFNPDLSVTRSDLMTLMQSKNSQINYMTTTDFNAYKENVVSSTNSAFFEVLNKLLKEDGTARIDGYFDDSCTQAIKKYQTLKAITSDGIVNEETYLHFVSDFYSEKMNYLDSFDNVLKG